MRKKMIAATIFLLFATSITYADTTLLLIPPEYFGCGNVTINGLVTSDGDIYDLVWDWGDGTTANSFFEAHHRYASNGTFTVKVTAAGCFPVFSTGMW